MIARLGTVVRASLAYVAAHGEPRCVRDLMWHGRLTLGRATGCGLGD